MSVSNEERDKLFRQFRHSVGAPIRQIELTDEQLCTLLEISIEPERFDISYHVSIELNI
jgi:hypothetical protein